MQAGQLPLGVQLRDSSVFASYFAGRNRPVVDALQSLRDGEPPSSVWLHGAEGAGKTHLLQAICAHAGQRQLTATYLPLSDASLTPELLASCGQISCVCVDNVEAIAGRREWERAMFSLYREIDERRSRLWLASVAPPAALEIGLADLASRLSGSLVLTLQPLDEHEQASALQLRAELRGFELPEETIQYLLRRLPRDMGSLYAFLDELDAASIAAQRRLTVPFVREVLERSKR